MTTTTLRRLARGAVLAAAMPLIAGCSTHPAGPISTKDLDLARSFRLFTVYWVGRSFDGVPLTAADTQRDYDAIAGERVYYGNCDKQSSILSTVGCRLPLEIATVEYHMIDSRRNVGLGTRTNTVIRGVPAVIFNAGRSIQLYTDQLAIDIYADTPARALAAAHGVVPLNRPDDPHPTVLAPPQFAKDVDPQLLEIERTLTVTRAAQAAASRAVAARRRRPQAGTTQPAGVTAAPGLTGVTGAPTTTGATGAPTATGATGGTRATAPTLTHRAGSRPKTS